MAMEPEKRADLISRGRYGPSPLGTAIFVGLRTFDSVVIQRALQLWDPLAVLCSRLGMRIPPPPTGGHALSILGHSVTPFHAVLWAMSIGGALKQNYHILAVFREQMTVRHAVIISLLNFGLGSFNNLAFSFASINPTWSKRTLALSIPMFILGILIETISEVQRRPFKNDPHNEGEVYDGGLFGYARSINYCGYMIWRGAAALAGGGLIGGFLITSMFWYDFTDRAIPVLDRYCSRKYGKKWEEYKRKVPYAFFPGIY